MENHHKIIEKKVNRKRKFITEDKNEECNNEFKKFKPAQKPIHFDSLNTLPIELKVLIFKYLDSKDLSNLSIVCKSFRDVIINHFLNSKEHLSSTFKQISNADSSTKNYLQMSTDLGLLIKRSTFILPSYRRIKLIINIFETIDLKNKLKSTYEQDKSGFKNFTKAIKCIIGCIIAGWRFKEVLKLVDEIEIYFNHTDLFMLLMTKEFGVIRAHEQYIRFFYRKILLESFDDNITRCRWLGYFINYHTNFTSDENKKITYQAKLLILLFAPIFQEENSSESLVYIDWFCFHTTLFLQEGLEYLGFALKLLNFIKPKFRPNVCALFIAITNIGFFWSFENASALLYHSGLNIIKEVIDYSIKRDNFIHLVRYLANLFVVEYKMIALKRISHTDKIMGKVYDYLKISLHPVNFESILDLISSEFICMGRTIDNIVDIREYLEASDIIGGLIGFYEVRMKKMI